MPIIPDTDRSNLAGNFAFRRFLSFANLVKPIYGLTAVPTSIIDNNE